MSEQTKLLLVVAAIGAVIATVLVTSVLWLFPTDDYSRTESGCVTYVHKDAFTFENDPSQKLCPR